MADTAVINATITVALITIIAVITAVARTGGRGPTIVTRGGIGISSALITDIRHGETDIHRNARIVRKHTDTRIIGSSMDATRSIADIPQGIRMGRGGIADRDTLHRPNCLKPRRGTTRIDIAGRCATHADAAHQCLAELDRQPARLNDHA